VLADDWAETAVHTLSTDNAATAPERGNLAKNSKDDEMKVGPREGLLPTVKSRGRGTARLRGAFGEGWVIEDLFQE
jgi:hypothetical protein